MQFISNRDAKVDRHTLRNKQKLTYILGDAGIVLECVLKEISNLVSGVRSLESLKCSGW